MQTYLLRKALADAAENMPDMSNEQVNTIRYHLGLYPMNFETGEEILPASYDPNQMYYIDNILYIANIGFLLFVVGLAWSLLNNLKRGISYPISLKING